MKPNLFLIANKELSQDAFFAWLLSWADCSCKEIDENLNKTAREFVKFLLSFNNYSINIDDIKSVEVGRQWENIDVYAEINKEYFIAIEDKTNTSEHSKQLDRYKKIVDDYYQGENGERKKVFIYLKTGLESLSKEKEIESKFWKICNRDKLLGFLNTHKSNNDIYNDFVENLNYFNKQENLFREDFNSLNNWETTKGLYKYIQTVILEEEEKSESDWNYVPNASGGFLGFWFHSVNCKSTDEITFYL